MCLGATLCLALANPLEDHEVKDDLSEIEFDEDVLENIENLEVRAAMTKKECKEKLDKFKAGFKNCMERGNWENRTAMYGNKKIIVNLHNSRNGKREELGFI